jgi:nucleotide-binding universal stress UspA family protein
MTTEQITRVVALVDGSEPSKRAALMAAQVARGLAVPLELIKVAEAPSEDAATDVAVFEAALHGEAAVERSRLEQKRAVLEAAAASLPAGSNPTLTLLEGRAKDKLMAALDEREGALVFLGRTGKNALTRVLKGSVATTLATYGSRPVVIVP